MIEKVLFPKNQSLKVALQKLNELPDLLTLFIIDEANKLVGTLTDGDVRRGLINDIPVHASVSEFMHTNYRYLEHNNFNPHEVEVLKQKGIRLLPILDNERRILKIIDLSQKRALLPVDAVIMAGGKGTRLRPHTLTTPKPLLKVGEKPIIEYNIDRLNLYGIYNLHITVKYLGQQIIDYFGDGTSKEMAIRYVEEEEPLGTLGAISLIDDFEHDYILVMNSDILTNINFRDMFEALTNQGGDMIVATTAYDVKIPYGVIETEAENIIALKEKPTYTYYSNAGIYILKKSIIPLIPKGGYFDATDLIELLIKNGKRVLHFPILGYWLDIGKPNDFEKAQNDIKHIQF